MTLAVWEAAGHVPVVPVTVSPDTPLLPIREFLQQVDYGHAAITIEIKVPNNPLRQFMALFMLTALMRSIVTSC